MCLILVAPFPVTMMSKLTSKSFPGFSSIYQLGEPGHERYFRASLQIAPADPFFVTRGEAKPKEPVIARWKMGAAAPVDIVRTGYVAPVLISDSVTHILKGFTGWQTYRIVRQKRRTPPRVFWTGHSWPLRSN
jgi:hypothetical protein